MSDRRRDRRSRSMRPPAGGHSSDVESLREKLSYLNKRLREEEKSRQITEEDHDREGKDWSRKKSKLEHELDKARQSVHCKNGLLEANDITIKDLRQQLATSQSDQEKLRKTNAKKDEENARLEQQLESLKRVGRKTARTLQTAFGLGDDQDVDVDDAMSQDTLPVAARSCSSEVDASLPEPASAPAALGPVAPGDAAHAVAAVVPPVMPGDAALPPQIDDPVIAPVAPS